MNLSYSLLLSLFLFSACSVFQPNPGQNVLNPDVLNCLKKSTSGVLFQKDRTLILSKDQTKILSEILSHSQGYVVGYEKFAPFVPEIIVHLEAPQCHLILVFSPSSNQLKTRFGDQEQLFNYDPMASQLHQLFDQWSGKK